MHRYEIRGAVRSDEDGLLEVATHLDTVNLPAVREEIRGILDASERSFTGEIEDTRRHQYVFVLVDRLAGTEGQTVEKIIGTSMILSQLGRRDAPYIFVDVLEDERYSSTLDRHFHHTLLKVGYSYDGPTEIGGLILLPEYRRERLGQFISYVRFAYLKMHRGRFQDEILAELLPPLEADGTSLLWEAIGKHFTGMTYPEADLLSKKNKEFIKGLFPETPIHTSLLSKEAQAVIGKVGPRTRGVEKMLRRIGFRYADRVDPFDGGPHFVADTDDITLVDDARKVIVTGDHSGKEPGSEDGLEIYRALFAVELPDAPYFRSVLGTAEDSSPAPPRPSARDLGRGSVRQLVSSSVRIDPSTRAHLGLEDGQPVWMLPVD